MMIEIIRQPWHWIIAGFLIGLTVPSLLILGNKRFGISSSLKHICAICIPAKIPFFMYNWKKEVWNLIFVLGICIGAFIATAFLENPKSIVIAEKTQTFLTDLGIRDFKHLMPNDIFGYTAIFSFKGLFFLVFGGFLIGFGTRYADGCTSGHSIMGLSNLQLASLIATCCFMIGGFFSANVILPFFLKLFLK